MFEDVAAVEAVPQLQAPDPPQVASQQDVGRTVYGTIGPLYAGVAELEDARGLGPRVPQGA